MENFQVTAEIDYNDVDANQKHYFIHVITYTDQVNYRPGNAIDITNTGTGPVAVELSIIKDGTLPAFSFLNPVVHTIDLGMFDAAADPEIAVTVFLVKEDGTKTAVGNKTVGKEKLSTTEGEEDSKPIGMDARYNNIQGKILNQS